MTESILKLLQQCYLIIHGTMLRYVDRCRRGLSQLVNVDFYKQGCDYPAIVPYEKGKTLFDRQLTQDERSVRGTVVMGLTEEDIRLLDVFEGDVRRKLFKFFSDLTSLIIGIYPGRCFCCSIGSLYTSARFPPSIDSPFGASPGTKGIYSGTNIHLG